MRLSKNQWRKGCAIGFFQRRINGAWHPSIKKFVGGGGFETGLVASYPAE
jgi:hypothetical protein